MTIISAPVFGMRDPDTRGYYCEPTAGDLKFETPVAPIEELTAAYFKYAEDEGSAGELQRLLRDYREADARI